MAVDSDSIRALLVGRDEYDFHRLSEIGPLVETVLRARAGIETHWTTELDALTAESIAAFDVVIDYTTNGDLTDPQWVGLRDFVRDGGGFVGLHGACATEWDTERPRPERATLVGGSFEGHDEFGPLDVRIVDHDHPITSGLDDFQVLDEPYRCRVTDDVRVLTRVDRPDGTIPAAWVHTFGAGNACYCAHGHDERAFAHPSVQRLLTRGVRWATGVL
jgi:type 1 glutamine amidotransferase